MKTISSDNPLRDAKWIWPGGDMYLQNCHAQFRCDFDLPEIPEKAPLFISADQWYRLHVNGRYVCRGPARGYQDHWPCDEVDLRDFLKPGRNFIAVEAYNPGIGTFQYLHRDAAGMICAADWGATKIRSSKASWIMRRAPGENPNVARLSRQMGFQEDFDASADDLSWISSPSAPSWPEAKHLRWFGQQDFGKAPWRDMEERGIPLLRETLLTPSVSSQGVGLASPGFERCFNIAWQWQESEIGTVKEWLPGSSLKSRREADGLALEVEPVAKGEFRAVTLALPAIQIGTLGLEVEGCSGDEIVDCHYFQYLKDGIPQDLLPVGNGGLLALATRLRAAPGRCSRMFMNPQGAAFVVLVFRSVSRKLSVKAVWRTMEYPFSMRGKFETSEKLLNDIHRICRQTQQACSADSYLDTPWREQGQWWGDARVQARNTFFIDGDPRLLRRGIASIAGQETPNGLTFGVAPCCCGTCVLPDFSLTWVLTIFDLYWQTGELETFFEQHERIKRIFAYFESPEGRGADGLLKFDKRYWLFEDWAPLFKNGAPAFLNLWHLYALRRYERLLRAAKLNGDARKVAAEIASRSTLLENAFFDERQGLFAGGRTSSGSLAPDVPSLHDQVLAILNGLKPELHRSLAEKRLLPFLRGEPCDFPTPTSFWCTYLFDAAKLLGFRRETLDFIRANWGKMLYSGGTWEHFVWNKDDGQSCCHAWSAHPVSHLVELMTGLRQLKPAWTEFECSPDPDVLTESGDISVPLPQGDLKFAWKDGVLSVFAPEGSTMRLLRGGRRSALKPGLSSFRLSSFKAS